MRRALGTFVALTTLTLMSFTCVVSSAQEPPISSASAGDKQDAKKKAAVVREYYNVMAKGDWKAALAFFSEDTRNFGRPVG